MPLRSLWLGLSLVLVVAGLLAGYGVLAGFGVLCLLSGGLARLWGRFALARVSYRRELEQDRAFVGDTVLLTASLTNRKPLPLPWVEVVDHVPAALAPEGVRPALDATGLVQVRRTTALGWYQRAAWTCRLPCRTRGYHRLGPAALRSGDLFGLFEQRRPAPEPARLVVYPETLDLEPLGFASRRAFGEHRGTERLFEDPLRVSGVRDYQPGDPMKRIAWGPTARTGRLLSRVYEPSTTPSLLVVLNVATMPHTWEGYDPELLERAVSVAASVARDAAEARYAVGLLANASFPEADRPLRIPPGRSPDQLPRVLEALAAVSPFVLMPMEELLERERTSLPWGATVVAVTALLPEPLQAVLLGLRDAGHPVHVVSVAREPVHAEASRLPVANVGAALERAAFGPGRAARAAAGNGRAASGGEVVGRA
ncbi:MAG TPA: DUF58 domain-containing protein [Dehalococcoidia bacterium]